MSQASMGNKKELRSKYKNQQKGKKTLFWLIICAFIAITSIVMVVNASNKPKAEPIKVDYSTLPILGKADAPVKIIEVGDFKCPACAYFASNVDLHLKKDFIDSGKVAIYFVNMPFIGPDSTTAALAAQSIFHQNNDEFWKFYNGIYQNQRDEKQQWATKDNLITLAKGLKLNVDFEKLAKEIDDKTWMDEVTAQAKWSHDNKVDSTPTVFINGKIFTNANDYKQLKGVIEGTLKTAEQLGNSSDTSIK
jgi:protein-disulfide isomerase